MTSFGYNVLGFGGNPSDEFYEVTISSNVDNFNLATHLSSNTTYNGSTAADFFVTINSGVVVGGYAESSTYSSSSPAFPESIYFTDYSPNKTGIAFDTGSLGSGSRLFITNDGTILGFGGRGGTLDGNGSGTHADGRTNRNGGNGGTAFKTTITTFFTNNGKLQGGGGGGGASAIIDTIGGSGGGGGAGAAPGLGGSGVGISGVLGQNATETAGASGGSNGGRTGGTGGAPGVAGANGTASGSITFPIGLGGSAGNYIEGNSLTTFLVTGTRAGGVA